MKHLTNILILLLLSSSVFGQIKKKDLIGQWQSKNDDSLYYKSDTTKLYKDINHFYNTKTCYLIRWTIDKRTFRISNVFTCTEPGRVPAFTDKEKIRTSKTDYGQVISLERNGIIFDEFKIVDYQVREVDRYPHEIKELRLMRFDSLSDFKLFNYVDSLIYKVLKYDSTLVDTTFQNLLKNAAATTVKIRNRNDSNPEPLIVLNGHIVFDKKILKQFRLVETTGINYLRKEESASIYGMRAINGVIILTVSEKRFKQAWKNYGR